jgi:hypothetical protein
MIDKELDALIQKRVSSLDKKLVTVGTGITSSHLGDERNIREFLIANSLVNNLRDKNYNVIFYLFDDSFDPLNFRQLRVAVNKDETLIKKFEQYCGMPIALIPDPYDCHKSYSIHYQNEILKRFHSLNIFPSVIDIYSSYKSGLYDFAKEIVFTRYKEIQTFLKKNFPQYTMKNLFYPICMKCLKLDGVEIKKISKGQLTVVCSHCEHIQIDHWKNIQGKFSWKIDVAIKWNIFKVDFEPYSKAYLDPDVGSYFIAKKLSQEFFGGNYPESVNYGQIIMGKILSYKILPSFPVEALNNFFVEARKKDLELSEKKLIQLAHDFKIAKGLSYYDYVTTQLAHDLLEEAYGNRKNSENERLINNGIEFSKNFLKRDPSPQLPTISSLTDIDYENLLKIKDIFHWVVFSRLEKVNSTIEQFSEEFRLFLQEKKIPRGKLFHTIRQVLSQQDSLPMYKIFYYAPITYLSGCLMLISQALSNIEDKNGDFNRSSSHYETLS